MTMKKKFFIIAILFLITLCISCNKKEKKPYGAENIDYERVENINKEGPTLTSEHIENAPPISKKTVEEEGPWHIEQSTEKIEPTADWNEFANDGAVPIYEPEHRD